MDNNREKSHWHLSREISLPGLVVILGNTVAIVWGLASVVGTVNTLATSHADLKAEVKVLATTVVVPTALSVARIETLNSRMFTVESQLREMGQELNAVRTDQSRGLPKRQQ